MWQYRELIWTLAITDLKNRYENTSLGFFWSLLSPLLFAGVLYFVFRNIFGGDSAYVINILIGLMGIRFFQLGTSGCLRSIASKSNLVTKVYIPRYILVVSTAISSLISSLLEFIILIPVILIILRNLTPLVILYPLVHIVYFLFITGVGFILSSIYVYFRDLDQIWTVLLQILFFASPIFYPMSAVGSRLLPYYKLNPITCFITIYRDLMVHGTASDPQFYITVIVFAVLMPVIGYLIFSKLQRRFAEVI